MQTNKFTLSKQWFRDYDFSNMKRLKDKLYYDHILLEYAWKLQSTAIVNAKNLFIQLNRMNYNVHLFFMQQIPIKVVKIQTSWRTVSLYDMVLLYLTNFGHHFPNSKITVLTDKDLLLVVWDRTLWHFVLYSL